MRSGDLLTMKEAGEFLRVSHWTIAAWLTQKNLPVTKLAAEHWSRGLSSKNS
jgi:hypothetical protein